MSEKKDDSSESEAETFSHQELVEVTSRTLTKLLSEDPLLLDLPIGVTVGEVNAQIALLIGQSMTVYVVRGDNDEMPIVVSQTSATVQDLKTALRRHMALRLQRQKLTIKVSWPYIWRTYVLTYDSTPLKNDFDLLSKYGICNNSRVHFQKKFREKGQHVSQ